MSEKGKRIVELKDIADDPKKESIPAASVKGGVDRTTTKEGQFFDEADSLFGRVSKATKNP
tara:strand:- start:163 stop:345 length:183 start_codon:yes stop_codon:yes gene_type:complete